MASLLTQRALRVFAVLEDYRAGSPDILDALLPFFEPILAEFPGHSLNTTEFAKRVTEAYRWNFTSDIVEELIPRFLKRGWLEQIGNTEAERAYRVTYEGQSTDANLENVKIIQSLLEIAQEFSNFIKAVSPLTAFAKSTTDLSEILVEWLISIDAYTEDVLKQKALQTTYIEGQIGLTVSVQDSGSLSSEERYLCARFVKHLFDVKSPFVTELCRLASIGLLTEVVQDFHKPTSQVNRTQLIVYLDAPVALDLLGVSGTEAASNIRPIIKTLQEIGTTVRIFRASVQELQRALDAILKRPAYERTGPTAEAIRRNQVLEAFVRQIALDPETALLDHRVTVIDRDLTQFPNEHQFFTEEAYEDFYASLNWHHEIRRREHDAIIIAQVIRMRGGKSARDIFQTKHILITRNALLCQSARKFGIDHNILEPNSVGPAIHQRQLAAAVWLRTGLSGMQQEIPRHYLLAACERVLELKKGVVDQVRLVARSLTPEKAKQLDLLLTQDRSTQLLMDRTLGATNVVTPNNIEPLIEEMRHTLTREIEDEAAKNVVAAKQDADKRVRAAGEKRKQTEKQNIELTNSLAVLGAEDKHVIQSLLDTVNGHITLVRWSIKLVVGTLILLIGLLPYLTEQFEGHWKTACLITSGILASIFAYFQIFDRPVGIENYVARAAKAYLNSTAKRRGLLPKMDRTTINYENSRFTLLNKLTLD